MQQANEIADADLNPRHNYRERQLRRVLNDRDAIRLAMAVSRDHQYRAQAFYSLYERELGACRDEADQGARQRASSAFEAAHRHFGAADAVAAFAEMLRQGRHKGFAERAIDAEHSDKRRDDIRKQYFR